MADKYNSSFAEIMRKLFSKSDHPNFAVTLTKDTTYYNCSEKEVSEVHRKEEDNHKAQIAKLGFFRFHLEYLWQQITKGYKKNKFEVDAKK